MRMKVMTRVMGTTRRKMKRTETRIRPSPKMALLKASINKPGHQRRAKALSALDLPLFRNLVETNRRGRRSSRRRPLPMVVGLAHRHCKPPTSARSKEQVLVATERLLLARCRTVLGPRRRSNSPAVPGVPPQPLELEAPILLKGVSLNYISTNYVRKLTTLS